MKKVEIGLDAIEQPVAHHVVAKIDRGREPVRIGPAMAFHHNAVKPEEYAAIRAPDIELFTQTIESSLCQNIAQPRQKPSAHRVAQIGGELASRALGGLERDIS